MNTLKIVSKTTTWLSDVSRVDLLATVDLPELAETKEAYPEDAIFDALAPLKLQMAPCIFFSTIAGYVRKVVVLSVFRKNPEHVHPNEIWIVSRGDCFLMDGGRTVDRI